LVFGGEGVVDIVVSKGLASHIGGKEIAIAVLDIASHVARMVANTAQAPVRLREDIQQEGVELGRDRTSDESLVLVEIVFRDVIGYQNSLAVNSAESDMSLWMNETLSMLSMGKSSD
jgi:hypothetical protein